ncbi:MAG: response regulator [Lachnospiraceae bacterium]|nr:response regulator [Lachnospiraceae bacterium]
MRELLLGVQYASIFGFFLEAWIVFRNLKGRVHSYLLVGSVAALINSVGYVLELKADSESTYITALQFSYLGRTWYAFFIFLFVAELTGRKIPSILRSAMMLIDAAIYCVIFTLQDHNLYYTDTVFDTSGVFPRLHHGNGIIHHLNIGFQFMLVIVGLVFLLMALGKEKKTVTRKSYITVIMASIVQSFFLIAQLTHLFSIAAYFDVSMIGYFIGNIMMLVAIISFDLLGTGEIAKEFVADKLSEGIIAVDDEGNIRYYNEPAASLYPGLKGDDPGSGNTGKIPDAEHVLKLIKEAASKKEYLTIKDHFYLVEENELVHDGRNYGTLYAIVDETEHIHYTEELERQKMIADNANEAKSRFLANMSHEIRTPINAVLGLDEVILRETGEDDTRKYASDIMSAGKTLLSLINDILDLSKVEEGKMEIIPVQYELSSLVRDLVNMVGGRAENKGLKFTITVNEHIPNILMGDEIRIRQCVLNILTNAIKYTEKGSVDLKIDYSKPHDDTSGRGGIMLMISVTDTGIGMKPNDLAKLLKPYQRLDEKRNRFIEGTGLGMSITSQLLGLMGSRLEVKSEYGKGTCMSFSLLQEVVSEEEIGDYNKKFGTASGLAPKYKEKFHAPSARILVVDDTEMNLMVLRHLLKQTQVKIDTAKSGREALDLNRDNPYDVMFIDHMMPEMDGLETLKRIRKSGYNGDTPAIALTANAVSGAREMYLEAGFTDYLSKPIESDKLEKMLAELIPASKIETVRQET